MNPKTLKIIVEKLKALIGNTRLFKGTQGLTFR